MKIAHVLRRFSDSDWGGSETAVFHLCQELGRKGIASPIFCTDALSHPGEEDFHGVIVKRFRSYLPWFFLSEGTKRQLELKGGSPLSFSLFFALLFEKDVTVIHTHVQKRLGGIARTVAKLKRIPYVVSLHSGYLTLPTEQAKRMLAPTEGKWEWGKLFGALLGSRHVLRDAAAIVCVGRDEYEAICAQYPQHAVYYVPNGVDLQLFAKADPGLFRQAIGLHPHERIVLCVSRIDYQKNQLLLVRAFAKFAEQHPDHRLVLIGPVTVEAYANELWAEAERLNIRSRMVLLPGYSPTDPLLASAYKAAEIFVLPSVTEPFGIVILEAWAAGAPVIASRVGGIPGFTHDGTDVVLFDSDNEPQLVEKLTLLADSTEQRTQLSERGLTSVKEFDWTQICDRMMSIYNFMEKK